MLFLKIIISFIIFMRLANIVSISFAITLDEKFKFSVYPQCKITLKYKYETACTYSMVLAFRIHIIYIYIFFFIPTIKRFTNEAACRLP